MGALGATAAILLAAKDSATGTEAVRERGELVVALREGPASYYTNSFGAAGFEYELARGFARELGVKLRVVSVRSAEEALDQVESGHADMAGGLALTLTREARFGFSVPVQSVSQFVVCPTRDPSIPVNVAALQGRSLVIAAGSHHAEKLAGLQPLLPGLAWQEVAGSEEALLALVHQHQADCAVIDANVWAFHRPLYPDLRVAVELPEAVFFGWVFKHSRDESLREDANAWLARKHADGTVTALREHHLAHLQALTQFDSQRFYQALRHRLPRYVGTFRREAERAKLDWRLLAAVSYQESLWDPAAQSPTGVQGLMQLTMDTALHLGIDDRTDPQASIHGGARYLRQVLDMLPAEIPAEDRTWMALAAYNAGIAHVLDARELAARRGGNPNDWDDVRASLALLKDPKWYSQTRYGYARGATQAIVYVRHVRRYYDLLVLASNSGSRSDVMLAMGYMPGDTAN
ncbi:MAG: membrane-bound lytic murein transglycosylase MltF [Pseudomonadota bacterium]